MKRYYLGTQAPRRGSYGAALLFFIIMILGFIMLWRPASQQPEQPSSVPAVVDTSQAPLFPVKEQPASSTRIWTKVISVTLLIVIIFLLFYRVYGRRLQEGKGPGLPAKVLGRRYLDAKHSLVLIEVEGHRLLLGLTDHSIQLIKDFTTEEGGGNDDYKDFRDHLKEFED